MNLATKVLELRDLSCEIRAELVLRCVDRHGEGRDAWGKLSMREWKLVFGVGRSRGSLVLGVLDLGDLL